MGRGGKLRTNVAFDHRHLSSEETGTPRGHHGEPSSPGRVAEAGYNIGATLCTRPYGQGANNRVAPLWVLMEKLFSWFLCVSFSLLIISFFVFHYAVYSLPAPPIYFSLSPIWRFQLRSIPTSPPWHQRGNLMNSNLPNWPLDIWSVCMKLKFISMF